MQEHLFDTLFANQTPSILILISATLFIAGIVKGFLGIGLPAAAMGLLTLVLSPTHAVALLAIPILFTNFSQFIKSQHRADSMKTYWPMALTILLSIFITSFFLSRYPTGLLTITIGAAMVIVALNGLIGWKLRLGPSYSIQIGVGLIAGILGGLSSIWSPPVATYMIARGLEKERFIAATGFVFLVGAAPLSLGLYLGGVLTNAILQQSLLGLLFVMAGFRIGEILRGKISQVYFQKAVLIAFFLIGLRLIAVGIF